MIVDKPNVRLVLFSHISDYLVVIPEDKNVFDCVITADAQRPFEDELLSSVVKHLHQKVLFFKDLLVAFSAEETFQEGFAFALPCCWNFLRVASLRPSARFCGVNVELRWEALDPNDVLPIVHLFDMCSK